MEMPAAGGFLEKSQLGAEKIYPLTLSYCPDSHLVQIREVIPADEVFTKYSYKTGTIKTLVNHFNQLSSKYKSSDKILELGCNDLTFLKNFDGGPCVVGIDPSDVSQKAHKEGNFKSIQLENCFFNKAESSRIVEKYGKFDKIFSFNNFAHITDIRDYVSGVKDCLSDNGDFVVEVHYFGTIIDNKQFPFIYHEHQYYYTAHSLQKLLDTVDMEIYNYEFIDIHGGSIRCYISHKAARKKEGYFFTMDRLFKYEIDKKYLDTSYLVEFFANIAKIKKKTLNKLKSFKKKNKTIAAYGASGQATMLFSFYGIDTSLVSFIIDDSPLKIGKYMPKSHIPIVSREEIKNADVVLITAYTFAKEIIEKNKEFNKTWIIPLPKLEVL
jgi:SAM-dependent methyltransferase